MHPIVPIAVLFIVALRSSQQSPDDIYAFCGNCFCIHGENDCPTGDEIPSFEFSAELLDFMLSIKLDNPMSLSCNPYKDKICDTSPPQVLKDLGDTAKCGVVYDSLGVSDDLCPTRYKLVTFESMEALLKAEATLTHHGACGVCSTLQDLAVYNEKVDLVSDGTKCSVRGILNEKDGIKCFMETGFTEECAKIWLYNGYNTADKCRLCVRSRIARIPNNGPPPICALNDCLQCDETESGPIFLSVAARSRRRSGLLSRIARPCSSVLIVNHTIPCDYVISRTNRPVQPPGNLRWTVPYLVSVLTGLTFLVAVTFIFVL